MVAKVPYEQQLKPLNLRVTPESKNWIATQAKGLDVPVTVLVRAMLTVAAKHWREVVAAVTKLRQAEKEAGL